MSPATAAPAENRVLLKNVAWSTYVALASESDRAGTRFTYYQGRLEIMSPSREHESVKRLLGRMIETATLELGIPISSGGSTTLKSYLKRCGVEPDECYYVAHEAQMRGKADFDPTVDPPPDLAIEVDISTSSIEQLPIYAALGVPEVWLCDGAEVRVWTLQADGAYRQEPRSRAFPFLPIESLQDFLSRRGETDETSLLCSFRDWVRGLKA